MENLDKVREARLRRLLSKQRYALRKSRQRNPEAIGYGGFMIVDAARNYIVAGANYFCYSFDLDDVEAWARE
jgi:hypothetical protein